MNRPCECCGAEATHVSIIGNTIAAVLCANCLEHIARITAERFNRMIAETSNPKPATSPEGASQAIGEKQ